MNNQAYLNRATIWRTTVRKSAGACWAVARTVRRTAGRLFVLPRANRSGRRRARWPDSCVSCAHLLTKNVRYTFVFGDQIGVISRQFTRFTMNLGSHATNRLR